MTFPFDGYEVDPQLWPSMHACAFDLEAALSAVVAVEASAPHDAFTALSLGTRRLGNGVVIGPAGLVLTIGYLLLEAEAIVLTLAGGRSVQAHALGVDPVTGLGLAQALEPLGLPTLPLGDSRALPAQAPVILAGAGGRRHAALGRVVTRQPFAGYWEYLLDEAIITKPAHPHWSGAALIGPAGDLVGIGSLNVQTQAPGRPPSESTLFVPAELLPPILDDLASGRPAFPPRPWLGVLAHEAENQVVVAGARDGSPAARAELRAGDRILAVAGLAVCDLRSFYTALWACGPAGTTIPLQVQRESDVFDLEIRSVDRGKLLKQRRLN